MPKRCVTMTLAPRNLLQNLCVRVWTIQIRDFDYQQTSISKRDSGGWFICGTHKGHFRRSGARQGAVMEIKCCMVSRMDRCVAPMHTTTQLKATFPNNYL